MKKENKKQKFVRTSIGKKFANENCRLSITHNINALESIPLADKLKQIIVLRCYLKLFKLKF